MNFAEQMLKNMGIDPEAIRAQMENFVLIASDMQSRMVEMQRDLKELKDEIKTLKGKNNE